MINVQVESQQFAFPDGWRVGKVDDWSFYRNQFQNLLNGIRLPCPQCGAELRCKHCDTAKIAGGKSVDLLAITPDGHVWLIEVKDYRQFKRTKAINLADEVALKVRDTLSILLAASFQANHPQERELARLVAQAQKLHVVLHLEQPANPSKIRPLSVSPVHVLQRLRQLVKAVAPHPHLHPNPATSVDWIVTEINQR